MGKTREKPMKIVWCELKSNDMNKNNTIFLISITILSLLLYSLVGILFRVVNFLSNIFEMI